jgi:autonomous glycyl radical cofactor GrcA
MDMVADLESVALSNLVLTFFNDFVHVLNYSTALGADHVVVVFFIGQFEYRRVALEAMPLNQTGGLELRQYTINRSQ